MVQEHRARGGKASIWQIANDAATPHPFVTFISTETQAVLGHIIMDGIGGRPDATGGIEQCQWSHRTGKFYINLPATAARATRRSLRRCRARQPL